MFLFRLNQSDKFFLRYVRTLSSILVSSQHEINIQGRCKMSLIFQRQFTFGGFGHPPVNLKSFETNGELPKDGESESVVTFQSIGRFGTIPAGGGKMISVSRNHRGGRRIMIVIGKLTIILEWS